MCNLEYCYIPRAIDDHGSTCDLYFRAAYETAWVAAFDNFFHSIKENNQEPILDNLSWIALRRPRESSFFPSDCARKALTV